MTTLEAANSYRRTNSKIRSKMKEAKEDWIKRKCSNIEEGFKRENSKQEYRVLRILTKTQQPMAPFTEDSSLNLLTESSAVLARWTEY